MNTIDFFISSLADFLAPDSGVEDFALWNDGTKYWFVVGGQTGGWSERERVWVHDHLYGGPHEDKQYSGYWAYESLNTPIYAVNLKVDGVSNAATSIGWPVAVVAAGDINVSWEIGKVKDDQSLGFEYWKVELIRASDGVVVFAQNTTRTTQKVTGIQAGIQYLLRVGAFGVPRGIYQWPPENYKAITGKTTDFPSEYRWQHPTLGQVYYDPIYKVGARPYDTSNAIQLGLLNRELEAETNGTSKKNPDWTPFLVEFDSTGAQLRSNSEPSLLRISTTTWNENIAKMTSPSLWRREVNSSTLGFIGSWQRWEMDCGLRMVGALEIDPDDGSLCIGGAVSSTSGPVPVFMQVQKPTDVAGDNASGNLSVSVFKCECTMPLGKGIRSMAKTEDGWLLTSPCDRFKHSPEKTLFRRLTPYHPGGRNMTVWKNGINQKNVFSAEGGDFAASKYTTNAPAYLVLNDAKKTGAPLGKQLDSQLAIYGQQVWGVQDSNYQKSTGYQLLGSSDTGETWNQEWVWNKQQFDGGVVCRMGNKSDGGSLWIFGTQGFGSSTKGLCYKLQGKKVDTNIQSDYFIQRAKTTVFKGEEIGLFIGLKSQKVGNVYNWPREQYLLVSKGILDDAEPENPACPSCVFNENEGAKFSLISMTSYEEELDSPVSAIAFFPELEHDSISSEMYQSLYPECCWVRVDADEPLIIEEEDDITEDVLERLDTFDQIVLLGKDRFLAVPAKKRIEVAFLLAPEWRILSKNLKKRF